MIFIVELDWEPAILVTDVTLGTYVISDMEDLVKSTTRKS